MYINLKKINKTPPQKNKNKTEAAETAVTFANDNLTYCIPFACLKCDLLT